MATDYEVRTAGYNLPVGTDLISGGDNAISKNAHTSYNRDEELADSIASIREVTDSGPQYMRGTLDASQSLDDMRSSSWNGTWAIGSANANPGLPATPGYVGLLTVRSSGNDHYQRLDFRFGAGSYERIGQLTNAGTWRSLNAPFSNKGTLGDGLALSSLTSLYDGGIHTIGSTRSHPDLPPVSGTRPPAILLNFPTGNGDTFQMLTYRFGGGTFWRAQTTGAAFTEWADLATTGGDNGGGDLDGQAGARLRLLELVTPPRTAFESTLRFSTYEDGEAYVKWLAAHHPERVEILDLGESAQGRAITGLRIGDPSKPALYVMASQHGDEPMGREAAYVWARNLLQDTSTDFADFLTTACIIVTPVVNVDKINQTRVNSTGTNLNANWATESTEEITAASSVLKDYDVVLTIDAHEGGYSYTTAEVPTAPEIAQSLKDTSSALFSHLESAFIAASEEFGVFPGSDDLAIARNAIPHRYKSSTLLLEIPSMLADNMYFPDVQWRHQLYMLAYDSVLEHFRANLGSYVTAKQTA